EALNVVAARLTAVQVFDTFSYRDVTTANTASGQGIDPFGPNAHVGSALMLGFAAPGPFTDQPLTVMVYPEQPLALPVLEAQPDSAPVPPPATFAYEYWNGAVWQPLQRMADETWALLRTGAIVVATPAGGPAKAQLGTVAASLYWLRLRLVTAAFDQIPR